MKIKSFLLSYLLLSVVFSNAQNDSLLGTWRLVDGKMTFFSSASSYYNKDTFKHILPMYPFSVVSKSTKDPLMPFNSNRMLVTNYYRQPLAYSNIKSLLYETNVSGYKPEGNNWYRKGDLNPAIFRDLPYSAQLLQFIFFDKKSNFK